MSHLKVTLPAAILLGGFLVCSTASYGKPEYTKATKKACAYCHVDVQGEAQGAEDAGKYYSGAQEPGRLQGEEVGTRKAEAWSRP